MLAQSEECFPIDPCQNALSPSMRTHSVTFYMQNEEQSLAIMRGDLGGILPGVLAFICNQGVFTILRDESKGLHIEL